MKIKPSGSRVAVKRDDPGSVTEGGIHLPGNAKDKPNTGVVIEVGPGRINIETGGRIPVSVSKGDRVAFMQYAVSDVTVDRETLLVMSEDEILGVVTE